ncbi:hypothetical protein RBA63_13160 [Brenneria goodwinii]
MTRHPGITRSLSHGRKLKHFYYGSGHLLGIALFTRDQLHHEISRTQGALTSRSEYDRLGRLHRRDVFTGEAQRPAPCRWSRRWDYDYRNNLVREERDDDLFNATRWQYDRAGRLQLQDGREQKERRLPAQVLSEEETGNMLVAVVRGLRNRVILEVQWNTGIRRMEAAAQMLGDIDLYRGVVVVRQG